MTFATAIKQNYILISFFILLFIYTSNALDEPKVIELFDGDRIHLTIDFCPITITNPTNPIPSLIHFIDPTHNTPNIPHNISLHAAPHTTSGGRGRKIDKIANGDIFPPLFVRNRLKMFHLEFENTNWSEMHRGYSIYKDYLSDIYEIIYHEFVVLLYRNNFISNDDVKTWILFLEDSGFIGISQCQR
eukprot:441397_1